MKIISKLFIVILLAISMSSCSSHFRLVGAYNPPVTQNVQLPRPYYNPSFQFGLSDPWFNASLGNVYSPSYFYWQRGLFWHTPAYPWANWYWYTPQYLRFTTPIVRPSRRVIRRAPTNLIRPITPTQTRRSISPTRRSSRSTISTQRPTRSTTIQRSRSGQTTRSSRTGSTSRRGGRGN